MIHAWLTSWVIGGLAAAWFSDSAPPAAAGANGANGAVPPDEAAYSAARNRMVREQLEARDIRDPRVLDAMRRVPRHLFVPPDLARAAYDDAPLPIGHGQTISQPYIVALMTALARPSPGDTALEIGTGSGYQAAVLAQVVGKVYSIEYVPALAAAATARLAPYANVTVRQGDGYGGWPELAPFDVILVTAAPEEVPPALIEQLKPGGRLVIPVGSTTDTQELRLIEKDAAGQVTSTSVIPVRFVPLRRAQPAP
jgi:protein-L-isoaspartate(D-aspartate) O-methyltransferase